MEKWEQREGSMVSNVLCSWRGPYLVQFPEAPSGNSQLPGSPAPEDLTPLARLQTPALTCICLTSTPIKKKDKGMEVKKDKVIHPR